MRLLLLAVLALAVVALGATQEPHEGCDYDFGAGNGTAYLVVNNPYNLMLPLNIIYQIGERKNSTVLNVSNTRVIAFCGLGHGWLYIQQHESPLRSPLAWYPLAVPRYVVLRAGESATMSVTTLFAPAVTIAAAFLLLVAVVLRPRLGRSAVYALPDALRDENIHIKYFSFIIMVLMAFIPFYLFFTLLIGRLPISNDIGNDPLMEVMVLLIMYITLSLGGFYLSFHRGLFNYYYLVISTLVNIFLWIKYSGSVLYFSLFTLSIIILLTSSITLLSFYNLFMTFFLSTYGIAAFIYYDANFGRPITWSLPLQIPAIAPEIWLVIFPVIVTIVIFFLFGVIMLTYGIDIFRGIHTAALRTAFWPPLWWWFGLGIFALDELAARSLLHRLSASGGVVVELPRGGKAIVVSADLYGMYLYRLGEERDVSNGVKWVRYGEVKFRVSKIIEITKRSYRHVAFRFIRKVVLPILVGVSAYFMTKYIDLLTILTFLLFLIVFLFVYHKYNDFRELKEYYTEFIKLVTKLDGGVLISHIFLLFIFLLVSLILFAFLTSDPVVLGLVILIAIVVSFLSRADPELSRYLFPWLELRLMCIDGLVIGLARGGCLQRAKVGVAPLGSDIVMREEDCVVVVSPYDKNVRSGHQRYLCGPACPPVRVVVDEELQDLINTCLPHSHEKPVLDVDWRRVAVGVLDIQKYRYYYYVVDSSR